MTDVSEISAIVPYSWIRFVKMYTFNRKSIQMSNSDISALNLLHVNIPVKSATKRIWHKITCTYLPSLWLSYR